MSRRVLRMLLLCAGLLFAAAPQPAPAAPFGLAAALPRALDVAAVQVRGGWHWRRFWRHYRRRHHLHRHRPHRHWHRRHHERRHAARERLRFEAGRSGSGRDATRPPPRQSPAREGSQPKLF